MKPESELTHLVLWQAAGTFREEKWGRKVRGLGLWSMLTEFFALFKHIHSHTHIEDT